MFPLKFYCWFWGEGCPQAAQSARGASCPAALCPYPGLWPSHVTGRPGTAEHPSSRRPEGISRVVPQSPVPTGWTGGVQPHPGPTELSFPSCRAFVGSGGAQPGGAVRRLPTGFPVPATRRLPVGRPGQRPSLHTASWASSSQARRVPTLQTALTAGKGAAGGQGSPSQLQDCPRLHAGRAPWAWAPRAAAPGGAIRPTPSSLPCCGPGAHSSLGTGTKSSPRPAEATPLAPPGGHRAVAVPAGEADPRSSPLWHVPLSASPTQICTLI